MPRDSAGNYSLPAGYLAVTGETILASQHNPALEDLAASMTNSLPRTGVAGMLADLPMGGFKVTGLADAEATGEAATFDQIVDAVQQLGEFRLEQSSSIAPTAEGRIAWDTDDNTLKVGDGVGTKTFSDDSKLALLGATDQVITGGARVTPLDLGTITSGTVTPDPGDRPLQYLTNNGAFTLAPGSNKGSYLLEVTNAASAGAITVSGWTKVVGSFTVTNGQKFLCSCVVSQTYSLLTIQALQ